MQPCFDFRNGFSCDICVDFRPIPRPHVNRHSTVTHYQRPTVTQLQEGGIGGEVSEILFFSAKPKRRPSLIYSMQIIPVCLSIVARRKGVSATRRGGSNCTPISLLVGHPCKLFNTQQPPSHELLPCRRGRLPDRVRRGGGRKQDAGDPSPQTLRSTLGPGWRSGGSCLSCATEI